MNDKELARLLSDNSLAEKRIEENLKKGRNGRFIY